MTYLTIALPEAAKAYIVRVASHLENRQISSGNYGTAEEFLTALIEREQERQAKQKVNAMLRSTLQKDRTIEATDEWWEQQSISHRSTSASSMNRSILIHEDATLDIQEHCDYLAQNNSDSAFEFFDAARKTFAALARMPGMGSR